MEKIMKKSLIVVLMFFFGSITAMADDLGKKTYELACKNCHAPNLSLAIKSPAAFDKKVWKKRFEQATLEAKNNPKQFNSAMDYLVYSVKIGKGLMHHGGLCKESDVSNADCSDKALIAAIMYMSDQK
jgi:cytochrome c5